MFYPVQIKTQRRLHSAFSMRVSVGVMIGMLVIQCPAIADDLRSNVKSWQRAFNVVPQDQAYVARAQNIFKRLKAVVGKKVLLSELYILDSDNQPWAIALEDENVILSRGALDVVYGASGVSLEAKDARLAFILGHELNHIAKKDFWHEQVYRGFVSKNVDKTLDSTSESNSRRRESELRADEDGFIYASLAGFNTRELFTSIESESDFLHYWVRQTESWSVSNNFSATQRVQFLADTLQSLEGAVKYFQFGARLAHFGDYDNAEVLLNEFYKIYPSSQVLNNLGFVYLQKARQHMPTEMAYHFWFPLALDVYSGMPKINRSLQSNMPETASKYLEKAVSLLEESVNLDDTDIASHKNLAIAHIYLKQYSSALVILEKAIKSEPNDYQLRVLLTISDYENSMKLSARMQTSEMAYLIQEASKSDAPLDLLYNTARLAELTGDKEKASEYWSRLELASDKMDPVYKKSMCSQSLRSKSCETDVPNVAAISTPWVPDNNTGLTVGSRTDDASVKKVLKSWGDSILENLGSIDATIYQHANGNSVLVIDRAIAVINQKQHGFDFKQHLIQVNEQHSSIPLMNIRFGAGSVLSNGSLWAAKVRDERVEEIWFADELPMRN